MSNRKTKRHKKISRRHKLKILGLDNIPKDRLDDEILDKLYKKFHKEEDNDKDKKYKLTLEFLNALLKTIGETKIKKINSFQEVKRNDLLSDKCKVIVDEYIDRLGEEFGKSAINYNRKDTSKNYPIMLIKKLAKENGYNVTSKQTQVSRKQEDGSFIKKSWMTYTIK